MEVDEILLLFAIIISCISLVAATIFGYFQVRHNKNSVRPVCSIYLTNYANFLSARIENNGTGPLLIKDIKFTYNDEPIESIFELVSEIIEQTKFHRVIAGSKNDYSISVNGKVYIFSITPEDDETLRKLRNTLKDVKIYVTYTDIYEKMFQYSRELDLFSNDYKVSLSYVENYHMWS